MINKDRLDELSQPVVKIYNEMQTHMLLNIASRLGQDRNLLDDNVTEWQFNKLNQLNGVTEDNIAIISRNASIGSRELRNSLQQAGFEGISTNETILERAAREGADLRQPPPPGEDSIILDILRAFEIQANDTLNLVNSTMLEQAEQVYRDIINQTASDVLGGLKTPQQALRTTVRQWAHHGIPALIDSAGRQWGTEGYIRMVTRTMSCRVTNEMQEARFDEWGVDLIEISSHIGARPNCEPYQGRIFSRSGESNEHPPLSSTSIGEPDGLFGINCGHQQYPYFPGLSQQRYKPQDEERNKKAYENSQIQRKLERDIRNRKTEKLMLEAIGDKEGVELANAKIRAKQEDMRAFINETGRSRRRDREQIYLG